MLVASWGKSARVASPGARAGRGGCRAIALRDHRAGSLPGLALAAGARPVARAARFVSDPRRRRVVRTAVGAGDAATGCARHRLRCVFALPMAVPGTLRRPTLRVHRLRSSAMVSAWRTGVCHVSAPGAAGRRGCSQRPAAGVNLPGDGLRHPPPRCAWRPLVWPARACALTGGWARSLLGTCSFECWQRSVACMRQCQGRFVLELGGV